MIKFYENAATQASLTQALLIYSGADKAQVVHASLHDVTDGVVQPSLTPLTMQALRALETTLNQGLNTRSSASAAPCIWPANVLLHDTRDQLIAWFIPSHATVQHFDCPELGQRSETVNMPSLVMVQSDDRLHICAVKGKTRPEFDTAIFHAPMFNTYESGSVCLGCIELSFPDTTSQMLANQAAFLRGVNTHPNGRHNKTKYEFGLFALWKLLLEDPAKPWKDQWLMPKNQTLGQWLTNEIK